MKKTMLSLTAIFIISGCATQPQTNAPNYSAITPSDESREHPDYYKHFAECDWYATSRKTSPANTAVAGAAIGAGIMAASAAILGADVGRWAGLGALGGGVSSLTGSLSTNSAEYRQVMLQCMRDKGHQVY